MFTFTYVEQDGGMFMSRGTTVHATRKQAESSARRMIDAMRRITPGLEVDRQGDGAWLVHDEEGYQVLLWTEEQPDQATTQAQEKSKCS